MPSSPRKCCGDYINLVALADKDGLDFEVKDQNHEDDIIHSEP